MTYTLTEMSLYLMTLALFKVSSDKTVRIKHIFKRLNFYRLQYRNEKR